MSEHGSCILFALVWCTVHSLKLGKLKKISYPKRKKKALSLCRLNSRDFLTNYTSNCFIHSRLSTYQVLFNVYLKNPCFQRQQNVPWANKITHVIMISANTDRNGLSLAHYISKTSSVTCLFYCVFRNRDW